MNNLPKKRLPRDGAGSFDFPPETGAIKRVIGFNEFMEVYTVRATYRVKTPDILDPGRTLPNMPWSQSLHAPVGASNPNVARILLQSVDALGSWPLRNGKADVIKGHLHASKEEAIICEAAYARLKVPYDAALARINQGKLIIKPGMIECPSLPVLRDETTGFLTSAKRALQSIGEVFNQFYVPDGQKPKVSNANFEYAITRLETSSPLNKDVIKYLREVVPITKRIVDLRNGLEHPTGADPTAIDDFHITPTGITPPSWGRGIVAPAAPVLDEMNDFLQFLPNFVENVFFSGLLDNIAIGLPLEVTALPDSEVDPDCPIRYILRPAFGIR